MRQFLTGAFLLVMAALAGSAGLSCAALAQGGEAAQEEPVVGAPENWQLGFQDGAAPVKDVIHDFHNFLLVVIIAISLFVLALLVWVMVRYNRRANPEPSKFSHNTTIEVVWTLIPVIIVGVIAIWSYRVLEFVDTVPEADMTLKVTGNQWNWTYQYPDHGGFEFIANPVADDQLGEDYFGNPQPRLLAATEDVVVPVGATVRVIVTASDVLHNFALPAFGLKMDAVPGRLNETWFKARKRGMFYGQCSEICGIGHAFMPIAIRVVSQDEFDEWANAKREEWDLISGAATPQTRQTAEAARTSQSSGG